MTIRFHGGEPTLIGAARFSSMCERARLRLEDLVTVAFSIQTNGTRLSPEWTSVLREHEVHVGISLDGPEAVNDAARVDRKGRGTHHRVLAGIALLRESGIPFQILSVVAPGEDPLRIHRHFVELGARSIGYHLPAYTHDTVGPIHERFGRTPCADFLIPIFDEWWFNGTVDLSIREFWNLGRVIMGGSSRSEWIGNPPLRFVSVETDGTMQGLDKLRVCEDAMTSIGLDVHTSDFSEIDEASPFHAQVMRGMPLPSGCRGCVEQDTCAGGHLPNRYSKARGLDNPSVWCADMLALFAHVRMRMEISVAETSGRQLELARQRERALAGDG